MGVSKAQVSKLFKTGGKNVELKVGSPESYSYLGAIKKNKVRDLSYREGVEVSIKRNGKTSHSSELEVGSGKELFKTLKKMLKQSGKK